MWWVCGIVCMCGVCMHVCSVSVWYVCACVCGICVGYVWCMHVHVCVVFMWGVCVCGMCVVSGRCVCVCGVFGDAVGEGRLSSTSRRTNGLHD